MMTFIFILAFSAMYMAFVRPMLTKAVAKRAEAKALPSKPKTPKLSRPSKEILKSYERLPLENRPFDDITSILVALDVKHGFDRADSHFYKWNGFETAFTWECCRVNNRYFKCDFSDYRELVKTIRETRAAVDAQAHALKLEGVSHDLDMLKELTQALRNEAGIVKSVTKEITHVESN